MSEWRPIETVPIDERVLLWCPEPGAGRKVVGTVFGYAYASYEGDPVPKGDGMNGAWTFTYWMPLPEPPVH